MFLKYLQLPNLSVQQTLNAQITLHVLGRHVKTLALLVPVALMLNVKLKDIVLFASAILVMRVILIGFVKNVRLNNFIIY